MIDTKHLQLILAIAENGSLSKASQTLNLTPSALSHQLKKLEEQLGIKVFHRIDNQLVFTTAGKELKEQAEGIILQLESLEQRMNEISITELARYVHGYTEYEEQRLTDQAASVAAALHHDSYWPEHNRILEVGCGVGAQTEIIATQNPTCDFLAIDISDKSLRIAQDRMTTKGIDNVRFQQQDIRTAVPHKIGRFDHIFVCFVLEHLANPLETLVHLKRLLHEGGTITVIEGDHGSTFFYPDNKSARQAVQAQVALQQKRGGNADIGRSLHPLLRQAGYQTVQVSPRNIYVDDNKPHLQQGFIIDTFTAMIRGMSEDLLVERIIDKNVLEEGLSGLLKTAEPGGVFSYTFFKATASR